MKKANKASTINVRQASFISGISAATVYTHLNNGFSGDAVRHRNAILPGVPPELSGRNSWEIYLSDFWVWYYKQWSRSRCLMYPPQTAKERAELLGFEYLSEADVSEHGFG